MLLNSKNALLSASELKTLLDEVPDTRELVIRCAQAWAPELDAWTGAVVRLGARAGVPRPLHEFLYATLLPQERRARGERFRRRTRVRNPQTCGFHARCANTLVGNSLW